MVTEELCQWCFPGWLIESVKDHQIAKNTIAFPSVVEDSKEPLYLLKISSDESSHRIVNSISRKFQFDSGRVATKFELFTWQARASAIGGAAAGKWIEKLIGR